MGLEGVGMLREPMVEVLGLRIDNRSSFSPTPSPTPLGLRLGCAAPATPGPPWKYETKGGEGTMITVSQRELPRRGRRMFQDFALTEVRVPSLALVSGGTALRLVGGGGRRARGGGGGGGVFAGSVGDGAGADSGQTETAAGPSDRTLQLRDTNVTSEQHSYNAEDGEATVTKKITLVSRAGFRRWTSPQQRNPARDGCG